MAANIGLTFIEDCASGKYENPYELFTSMMTIFKIPAVDSFNYISRLISGLNKMANLPEEYQETAETLLACFNHLKGAMHAYKVKSEEELSSFCKTMSECCEEITNGLSSNNSPGWVECLWNTSTLEQTLAALNRIETLFRDDIRAICGVLNRSVYPNYLLPYTSITDNGISEVPGKYNDLRFNIIPGSTKAPWGFSAVTSNINEDMLANCNTKKTTMNSRKRLYKVFTTVPESRFAELKKAIPNLGVTCVPSLHYELVSVAPIK